VKYNPEIVKAYFVECGLPAPELEYKFHPERKWRFDFAWMGFRLFSGKWITDFGNDMAEIKVALEVDGGIWIAGAHNRGARIKKTWEKENAANILGWHILKCEPKELCLLTTVEMIRQCLKL